MTNRGFHVAGRGGFVAVFVVSTGLAGCSEPSRNDSQRGMTSGVGPGGMSEGDGAGSSENADGGSTTVSDDDGGGGQEGSVKFDLGTPADLGEPEEGCQKVDFLFVIDNSDSMEGEQSALVASFPGFVAGVMSTIPQAHDYHVGVITTDDYEENPEPCNRRGALVIATNHVNSSEQVCGPYAEGRHYMTNQDDLAVSFACAAKVGTSGDNDELPFASIGAALSSELRGPGGCNEGFLRDDALLVITTISDENDQSSGSVAQWYDTFVASKAGIESNIVLLNLISLPGQNCKDDGERQYELADMFTHGFNGSVCMDSYGDFFQNALSVVGEACSQFMPPG